MAPLVLYPLSVDLEPLIFIAEPLLLHQEVLADEVVVYLRETLVVLARVTHIGKHLGEGWSCRSPR